MGNLLSCLKTEEPVLLYIGSQDSNNKLFKNNLNRNYSSINNFENLNNFKKSNNNFEESNNTNNNYSSSNNNYSNAKNEKSWRYIKCESYNCDRKTKRYINDWEEYCYWCYNCSLKCAYCDKKLNNKNRYWVYSTESEDKAPSCWNCHLDINKRILEFKEVNKAKDKIKKKVWRKFKCESYKCDNDKSICLYKWDTYCYWCPICEYKCAYCYKKINDKDRYWEYSNSDDYYKAPACWNCHIDLVIRENNIEEEKKKLEKEKRKVERCPKCNMKYGSYYGKERCHASIQSIYINYYGECCRDCYNSMRLQVEGMALSGF